MAETGVGASCASLAHVSSMAASTLDADLMVTDDDADVVGAKHQHACVHQWRLRNAWMLDGRTQWMVLSATINNPSDAEPLLVHTSIVLLASLTPSMLGLLAEWYPSLPGAPPGESCTQAATVIESYLYPTRTGRMAAHGGHSRARRGRTVKMKIPVRLPRINSLCIHL